MTRGMLVLVGVILFFAFAASAEAATFGCEISLGSTCLSNQTLLVRLNASEAGSAPNNSHAQLANFSGDLYNYSVCCWTDVFRTMNNTCAGDYTRVIGLESTSNSHVQVGSNATYTLSACYNVTAGDISCEYPNDSCSAGFDGVASIASSDANENLTNAHVGEFDHYKRKVCCKIGGLNPPSVNHANLTSINTTKWLDLRCENGTVSDSDSDDVTLHYNWQRNGTSITVLNLPMDFDDVNDVTHDISGYGNDGSNSGATFVPIGGKVGGAFNFDGVSDYVSIADDSSHDLTDTLSISLWFKPLITYSTSTNQVRLVDRQANPGVDSYTLVINGNGKLHFGTNGGNMQSTQASWTAGTWYHVTATYESSGPSGKLYIDGQEETLSSETLDTMSGGSHVVRLGAHGANEFFNGTIDEVIIFNRSLTAAEIKTLYDTNNKLFNRSEMAKYDNWSCSITPVDSTGLNGTTVFSNNTYVLASVPSNASLIYPLDGNTSVFERFVNFNWTAEEPDGDQVNYTFNLTVTAGVCSIDTEQTNLQESNYTFGELCVDQIYWWNVTACDVDGCSGINQTFNFTVASVISFTLINNNTDFGTLSLEDSVTTDNYSVQPFLLENDGNVYANITFIGNNSPFTSVGLDNSAFQFKAEENETGSFNTTGSQLTYTPVPSTWTPAVKQLNYSDASDVAAVHINVTVPLGEPGGDKESNVTFRAEVSA